MDQKKKNIILISALGVLLLVIVGLVINKYAFKPEPPVAASDSYDSLLLHKDAVFRAEEPMTKLQKVLFEGKTFLGTTSESDNPVQFEFRKDGTFKGFTEYEFDDLGTWDVEPDDAEGFVLVVNTTNTTDRYVIGYNNNKDLTLKNYNGRTYVLSEK